MMVLFSVVFLTLSLRLLYISVTKRVQHEDLNLNSKRLYNKHSTIKAKRGTIYDSKKEPIAEDTSTYNIYAVLDKGQRGLNNKPLFVVNKEKTAKVLAKYLPISKKAALKIMRPKNKELFQVEFGAAGKNISLMTKQKIDKHKLPGIEFEQQQSRLYPNGTFASNLIGVAIPKTNKKAVTTLVGQTGLERVFDKDLAGKDGYTNAQYDVYGYRLPGRKERERPVKNGYNVYTTINSQIQTLLESEMNSIQSQANPLAMNAVLMEAKTGKIIAASQRPTYNSNTLDGLSNAWNNNLIQDSYEPGSTMKVFTLSAAIDSHKYDGTALYSSGKYAIDGKIVPDWEPNGWGYITYNKGFALSSNVAMAHLERQMGAKTWKKYIDRFHFLKPTGVNLGTELSGRIQFNYPIEQANTSFGQGIEVTPIQMMQAFSGVANDGQMVRPYLVSKVVDPSTKKVVQKQKPVKVGKPITAKTAQKVRKHMEDVVYKSYGTGRDYQINGYRVAAKTGTAQVSNGYGGYASGDNSYLYSVVGMVPSKKPKYILYITMKQPQLGSKSATKLMSEIFKPVLTRALQDSNTEQAKEKREVPGVTYHPVSEAQRKMVENRFEVHIVGDGNVVTKQSLQPGKLVDEGHTVFLLTNGHLQMPRMIGWSYQEVSDFCKIVGLQLKSSGKGYAISQSVGEGKAITKGDKLEVNFE